MDDRIKQVADIVCKERGVEFDEINTRSRIFEYVLTRYMIWDIVKTLYPQISRSMIGRQVGKRDNATVIHGQKELQNLLFTDRFYFEQYEKIKSICLHKECSDAVMEYEAYLNMTV